jgi:hypothetical protein
MLQSDAERLFDIYAKRCPNTPTRLVHHNRTIREANLLDRRVRARWKVTLW